MTLKTAVVAPMPRVSEVIAVRASAGRLHNSRQECRRSCSTYLILVKWEKVTARPAAMR